MTVKKILGAMILTVALLAFFIFGESVGAIFSAGMPWLVTPCVIALVVETVMLGNRVYKVVNSKENPTFFMPYMHAQEQIDELTKYVKTYKSRAESAEEENKILKEKCDALYAECEDLKLKLYKTEVELTIEHPEKARLNHFVL